jgi:hypothetical protein
MAQFSEKRRPNVFCGAITLGWGGSAKITKKMIRSFGLDFGADPLPLGPQGI